jgi:glycosyltransferase involved in cell wall biosynthesis
VPRLSAVICVHNEERRLPACLAALSFADELVVVLDRCTDSSAKIAARYGAKLVEGAWALEGPRRSAGVMAATGDWILEIDADELVGEALAAEVRAAMDDERFTWRRVPVDNYVGDRLIRHGWGGSFGTTLAARLYRRGSKAWGMERVHPRVAFQGAEGPRLTHGLHHQFADGVSDILRRLDRYTGLRAQDLREIGCKTGVADNALRGLRRFWKCYVKRSGWREGGWGLLIAVMAGLYPFISALRVELETSPEPVAAAPEPTAVLAGRGY